MQCIGILTVAYKIYNYVTLDNDPLQQEQFCLYADDTCASQGRHSPGRQTQQATLNSRQHVDQRPVHVV